MNFIFDILSYHFICIRIGLNSQELSFSTVLCSCCLFLEMNTLCSSALHGSSLHVPKSPFSKCRTVRSEVTKASVAVEQQTQQTKVALIRIGTRGRYSFSSIFCFWGLLIMPLSFSFSSILQKNCFLTLYFKWDVRHIAGL